jgi:hypothetical protein
MGAQPRFLLSEDGLSFKLRRRGEPTLSPPFYLESVSVHVPTTSLVRYTSVEMHMVPQYGAYSHAAS